MKRTLVYLVGLAVLAPIAGLVTVDIANSSVLNFRAPAANEEPKNGDGNGSEAPQSPAVPNSPRLSDRVTGHFYTTAAPEQNTADVDSPEALPVPPESAESAAGYDTNLNRRFHGVRVRSDGSLVGRVSFIDPHSLQLLPEPHALVTFVQTSEVVEQVRTDTLGQFVVRGLTPRAVYSVFAVSERGYSAFSFAAVGKKATNTDDSQKDDEGDADADQSDRDGAKEPPATSEISHTQFISQQDSESVGDDAADDEVVNNQTTDETEGEQEEQEPEAGDLLDITLVPLGDLGAAPLPPPPFETVGGGGGGGGGGLFLPIVIPYQDNDKLASPFAPDN